jgi:predicted nucleotidyltransferase
MSLKIAVPGEEIARFRRKNHVRRRAFFGQLLRDGFQPESHVVLLVEFEPGGAPGLAFLRGRTNCRNYQGVATDRRWRGSATGVVHE